MNKEILLLCCFGHLDEPTSRYFKLVTGQNETWPEGTINTRGGAGGRIE